MPDDTSTATRAYLDRRYRELSPAQKIARVLGLTEVTHALALADLRRRFPECTPEQLRLLLAQRLWPPELFEAFVAYRRAKADATSERALAESSST